MMNGPNISQVDRDRLADVGVIEIVSRLKADGVNPGPSGPRGRPAPRTVAARRCGPLRSVRCGRSSWPTMRVHRGVRACCARQGSGRSPCTPDEHLGDAVTLLGTQGGFTG